MGRKKKEEEKKKKSVAGRACKARWDLHDHRGGRRGRRASCLADGANLKHPSEPAAAYHAARRGVPKPIPLRPSTTQDRWNTPTMARRKVGVSSCPRLACQSSLDSALSKTSPGRSRARRIQSGQRSRAVSTRAARDCFLGAPSPDPHPCSWHLAPGSPSHRRSLPDHAVTAYTARSPSPSRQSPAAHHSLAPTRDAMSFLPLGGSPLGAPASCSYQT